MTSLPVRVREQLANAPGTVSTRIADRRLDVLLLHGHRGVGPRICTRRFVVGFRLVLARLLSSAALRFASRQGHFAVAIGFCNGDVVGLACGVVVELNLLVIDLLVRSIQRALSAFFAFAHLVVRLLLGLGYVPRHVFRRLRLAAAGQHQSGDHENRHQVFTHAISSCYRYAICRQASLGSPAVTRQSTKLRPWTYIIMPVRWKV